MSAPIHRIEIRDGVPRVYGRTASTEEILEAFMDGESPDAIARRLRLSPEDVEKAIRFECCLTCPCDTCAWARELGAGVREERKKRNGR